MGKPIFLAISSGARVKNLLYCSFNENFFSKKGDNSGLFFYFIFYFSTNFVPSRIRTQIIGAEVMDADHLTTTMAPI